MFWGCIEFDFSCELCNKGAMKFAYIQQAGTIVAYIYLPLPFPIPKITTGRRKNTFEILVHIVWTKHHSI